MTDHPEGPLARSPAPRERPDPWPAELDAAVDQPGATALCTSCLSPQEGHHWFCPDCGFPCGSQAAVMPFVSVFFDGELFRRGVSGRPEPGLGRTLFLVVYSAASHQIFAPVYWYWMFRKAAGRPICDQGRKDYAAVVDDAAD